MRRMLGMILGWLALLLTMSAANAHTVRIHVDEFTLVVTEEKLSAIEGFRVNGETYDVFFAGAN